MQELAEHDPLSGPPLTWVFWTYVVVVYVAFALLFLVSCRYPRQREWIDNAAPGMILVCSIAFQMWYFVRGEVYDAVLLVALFPVPIIPAVLLFLVAVYLRNRRLRKRVWMPPSDNSQASA